jgi:hypothetical protein
MSMNAQTRDAPMAGWPLLLARTVAVVCVESVLEQKEMQSGSQSH